MTNEELVLGFQQGHISFETVYNQCHRLIYKETNKWNIRGLDRDDIESLGLEAFYEACLSFDIHRQVKFTTHSITHIRYRMLNEHKKTKLEKYGGLATFISPQAEMSTSDRRQYEAGLSKLWKETHEAVEWNEIVQIIQQAVDSLNEPQQTIMKRHLFGNEDQFEIAKSMNTSNQRIFYHVKQGFKKIKEQLEAKGWNEPWGN